MLKQQNFFSLFFGSLAGAVLLLYPIVVHAADGRSLILGGAQIFWWVLCAVCLGVMVYGFILLRNGREDIIASARAKKIILFSVVGAGISLIFALVIMFIASRLVDTTSGGPAPVEPPYISPLSGFTPLGQFSKVATTYPGREEKNVPRNISILITFTEPILLASVADSTGKLNTEAISVRAVTVAKTDSPLPISGRAELSADGMILKITPDGPLGKKDEKIQYIAEIQSAVKRANGDSLFGSTGGYSWGFEVSGKLDNIPPFIESILPVVQSGAQAEKIPKNALIQLTFSEPMDPSIISGGKIQIARSEKGIPVEGSLRFGNNYRTVTFYPTAKCGKNSCGETMYCLPENVSLSVMVLAASLPTQVNVETPYRAKSPFNGAVDMAGNSLDGGGAMGLKKNGKAEGAPADTFSFSVTTTDQIHSVLPQITRIEPGRDAFAVTPNAPVRVNFSSYMDLTSLHNNSIQLSQDVSYWVTASHEKGYSQATISHDPLKTQTLYSPEVMADVHDAYQNCYNPCMGPR